MTSEIVKIDKHQLQRNVRPEIQWTDEQRAMIRAQYARGADDQEFAVLMEQARLKRLNPLLGQIHFVKRWTRDGDVWATQTSIDGFRSIADDTGLYDGQDEPEFVYEDIANTKTGEVMGKRLVSAKVKVYRKDISRPFPAIVHMEEFVQKTKNGDVTKMWHEKPHVMLAKCAEAAALRRAFPQDLGDLYTKEELAATEEQQNIGQQIAGSLQAPPKPGAALQLDAALERIRTVSSMEKADDLANELSPTFKGKKSERALIAEAFKRRRVELATKEQELPGEIVDAEFREPGSDDE